MCWSQCFGGTPLDGMSWIFGGLRGSVIDPGSRMMPDMVLGKRYSNQGDFEQVLHLQILNGKIFNMGVNRNHS